MRNSFSRLFKTVKEVRSMSSSVAPKILISHSEVPREALEVLKDKYELIFSPGTPVPSREQILKDVKGVVGILWWSKQRVDQELVSAAGSQLKAVAVMSVGYNHIDVPLLKSLNIRASNTPNVLNNAVAEIAVGLLLSTSRRLLEGYFRIVNDKWDAGSPIWLCGRGLDNATVGVIGLGRIGLTIAKRLKAFDVHQILYSGRHEKEEGKEVEAKFVPLDTLLHDSDFVILSCELNDATKHLLDKEKFQKMKPSAILVNISRGEVIKQEDLVEALTNKTIAGAGLDVMTPEPLPPDHPLTKLPNCVLAPHVGSATVETRTAMARLAAQNLFNALNDIPLLTPLC